MMAHPVKIYAPSGDCERVPEEVAGDLAAIKRLAERMTNSKAPASGEETACDHTLWYVDSEGDHVLIRSSQDVAHAITEAKRAKAKSTKIYVQGRRKSCPRGGAACRLHSWALAPLGVAALLFGIVPLVCIGLKIAGVALLLKIASCFLNGGDCQWSSRRSCHRGFVRERRHGWGGYPYHWHRWGLPVCPPFVLPSQPAEGPAAPVPGDGDEDEDYDVVMAQGGEPDARQDRSNTEKAKAAGPVAPANGSDDAKIPSPIPAATNGRAPPRHPPRLDSDEVDEKVALLRDMLGFDISREVARKMIVELGGRTDLIVRALVANNKAAGPAGQQPPAQ